MFRSVLNFAISSSRKLFVGDIRRGSAFVDNSRRLISYNHLPFNQKNLFSAANSFLPNSHSPTFLYPPQEYKTDTVRTLTKFSLQSGKRKTVKAVLSRFYRLDWGMWIRGKCGRQKKLYKKSRSRKRRLRQHVFTSASQSWLLDKMVTRFWRKPKYYIDDPYEPYHRREEYGITRKRPFMPM